MIRITNDGGSVFETRITDAKTGANLGAVLSVVSVTIQADANGKGRVIASVELEALHDVEADPVWLIKHPISGALAELRSMTFADGTTVTLTEGAPVITPPQPKNLPAW